MLLYSTKSKFYLISILLIVSFSVGYGILAYFLQQQKINTTLTHDVVLLERDFKKLNSLFQEIRFWEKTLLSQTTPKADMQFGSLIEEIRDLLSAMDRQELNSTARSALKIVIEDMNRYEINFNKSIQLKIKQSLVSTRLETNYRSMVSIILNNNNPKILKALFSLSHFMKAYHDAKDSSKYQALKLVIDSILSKLNELGPSALRMKGYLVNFNKLLDEDYEMERSIATTNMVVEEINTQMQRSFANLTTSAETLLNEHYQETIILRQELKRIFLLSAISGVLFLLTILFLFSKNIITPIRAVVSAMKEVKDGNMGARFKIKTKKKDEIVQLGLSFNDMLTVLQANNTKLVSYQEELEKKIVEISEQKLESQRLTTRLTQAQKMESIGNLAGGIAHDFNNILSSIIGFGQLAIDQVEKNTGLEDDLQEVLNAGNRAKELVKQILAFARKSEEETKPLQPGIITKEVLKFIRSSIPTSIDIRHHIDSDSFIMGNPTQIHQILMNLCTNAAYAMEDQGGLLEVSLKDILVEPGLKKEAIDLTPGDYIRLSVSDTGTGIPEEILNSIFEPYFTTKDTGEGTGMGLSVVHGIVETYGGRITVDSRLGQGSTFTIFLPITKKGQLDRNYTPEDLLPGSEKILFVDDESSIAELGKRALENLGYSVETKTDSRDALELFRSKPDDFDLVITDMTMPNMTGDVLASEMMIIRPDIPVILCTGFSKKISDESVAEIGIKAFVNKPFVRTDLAKTIRKVMDETNL